MAIDEVLKDKREEMLRIAGLRDVLIHDYMGVDLFEIQALLAGRATAVLRGIT